MGEECHAKSILKCFPDDNLVPVCIHSMSESIWKNEKNSMEGNKLYSLVDWDNICMKPPKSANDTKCICKRGTCVDTNMCLN